MRLLRLIPLTLIVLLLSHSSYAVSRYIFTYHPDVEGIDNQNIGIIQADNGILYVANRKGVLTYDGSRWRLVQTPNTPTAIAYDTALKRIVLACKNTVGYLDKDFYGRDVFMPIYTDHKLNSLFTSILCIQGEWSFVSDEQWLKAYYPTVESAEVPLSEIKKTVYAFKANEAPSGHILFRGVPVVNLHARGMVAYDGTGLKPVECPFDMSMTDILFSTDLGNGSVVICDQNQNFYQVMHQEIKPLPFKAANYVKANIASCVSSVGGGKFAIGTLTGGVVVVDSKTGKTESLYSFETGLPANEVYCVGTDNYNGVWIGHELGLSRVEYHLPIEPITNHPGFTGTPQSVFSNAAVTYLYTNEGIYLLKKNNKSHDYIMEQNVSTVEVTSLKEVNYVVEEQNRRLAKKNQKKGVVNTQTRLDTLVSYQEVVTTEKISFNTTLDDVDRYLFERINGIKGKCIKILMFKGRVLAATNHGLYDLKENNAVVVLRDVDVNDLSVSPDGQFCFAASGKAIYQITYKEKEGVWGNKVIPITHNTRWQSIKVGAAGTFVATTPHRILLYNYLNADYTWYKYNNYYSDIAKLYAFDDGYAMSIGQAVFRMQVKGDKLWKTWTETTKLLRQNYELVSSNDNKLWFCKNGQWRVYDAKGLVEIPAIAGLFRFVSYIFTSSDNYIYFTDRQSGVNRFKNEKFDIDESIPLFVNDVSDGQGKPLSPERLKLDFEQNSLRVHFASPYFFKSEVLEYSYFVDGLMENWSVWSRSPELNLPYIPAGEYQMQVKVRTVSGQGHGSASFDFRVMPPFYLTWWFYLIEFAVLAILLMGAIVLNQTQESTPVTKALTFLTLIVIVESIHVWLESTLNVGQSSPVYQLLMNVVLAMLISPFENVLEKFLRNRRNMGFAQFVLSLFSRGKVINESTKQPTDSPA